MNWDDYVRKILRKPSCFDDIVLSFGDDNQVNVPPIIKASIFILEKISNTHGIHNVIVFPERMQTSFIFTIMKTIYNIMTGKISYCYDPYGFTKGQKLKFENCVMEFDTIEKSENGKEKIFVKFAENLRYGLPIELAPYFQSTDTKRPLSKYHVFANRFNIRDSVNNQVSIGSDIIEFISNHKTHIRSTVPYVTSVTGVKELLKLIRINDRSIEDILLIGQVDYKGEIRNAGAGQLAGTPAITLAPDLFSVIEATGKGIEVQSIILDVSNSMLNAQLDVLDQLCRQKFPIVCVTDMEGSLDLKVLVDRDFNIWGWNEENITKDMYGSSNIILDKKLRNCANTTIEYCTAQSHEICDSLKLLYKHREDVELQSPAITTIYDTLFVYTLTALRNITDLGYERIQSVRKSIEGRYDLLVSEQRYIANELYESLKFVIENLLKVYSTDFTYPKIDLLADKILNGHYRKIAIIVSEKEDKNRVYMFWKSKLDANGYIADIDIIYPNEFVNKESFESDVAILTGWFSKKTMQRILFSYNTDNYLVLLYEYENRWKNAHVKAWKNVYNREGNKAIVEKMLGKEVQYIIKTDYHDIEPDTTPQDYTVDELEEIDLILREHNYRKYVSNHDAETTEALPVEFAGGYFAFFTPTRKLITVTDIIVKRARRIAIKSAYELSVGDFIVIRETQRDLIREIADIILAASGKKQYRQKAFRWIEALRTELTSYEFDDVYENLKSCGCTKDRVTVRRWIYDEDAIIPQDKRDLIAIAMATDDSELLEEVDEVYEAGRTVMSAHIKAGRVISEKLRRCIADELYSRQRVDPYNISDPITFNIDDVGKVNVLKIIDAVKEPIIIEIGNANKLFSL